MCENHICLCSLTLDKSWLTILSPTPVPLLVDPRCLQMASNSSKMMMCKPLSSPLALYYIPRG